MLNKWQGITCTFDKTWLDMYVSPGPSMLKQQGLIKRGCSWQKVVKRKLLKKSKLRWFKLINLFEWPINNTLPYVCEITVSVTTASKRIIAKQGPHILTPRPYPLQWRHNERDSISNHRPHDCLLNRLFRHRSKKTSKLRVPGLCAGNSPGIGEFPAQMTSNAENVSIWWRHHAMAM